MTYYEHKFLYKFSYFLYWILKLETLLRRKNNILYILRIMKNELEIIFYDKLPILTCMILSHQTCSTLWDICFIILFIIFNLKFSGSVLFQKMFFTVLFWSYFHIYFHSYYFYMFWQSRDFQMVENKISKELAKRLKRSIWIDRTIDD